MPAATRVGDKSTGHDNCLPVSAVEGSSNVFANGKPVVLVGDKYASHGCLIHTPHQGHLAEGSPSTFINGKPVGRVGDPISCGGTVAEGSSNVFIGNGNKQKLNKAFCKRNEIVTRHKRRKEDDIFFCLPLIAEAMGNKANEKDRIGWHYLRDMFYKWLCGEANADAKSNSSPFWVDIDWVLSYPQVYDDWLVAIHEKVTNRLAKEQLLKILEREGYFREETLFFDFTTAPWQEWERYYYQHVAVSSYLDYAQGLLASLGAFTFKFLPKGILSYSKDYGYEVEITEVAGFVYDTFNFSEDDNFWGLGNWSCEKKDVASKEGETYHKMNNEKFNSFRNYNNIGNDFLVLSKLKLIDITDKNS